MAPKEKKEAKEKKSKAGAAEPAAEAPAAAASAPAAAGGSVDMAELARLKDQVAQMESQLNKQAIKNHSENAVTAKFDVLKQYLQATVTSRKDVIKQQMRHVKVRMEEVQASRDAVRRETELDSAQILERLDISFRAKLSALQKDLELLEKHHGEFDTVGTEIGSAEKTPADVYAFMTTYPALCQRLDKLAMKPIKTELTVRADDLPREAKQRAEVWQQYQSLSRLVQIKDSMIEKLLAERDSQAAAGQSLNAGMGAEVAHWARLYDECFQQLQEKQAEVMQLKMAHQKMMAVSQTAPVLSGVINVEATQASALQQAPSGP